MSGQTLFKQMRFEELHRLQLDIETDCGEGYEFSNPRRESDRILCMALSDNRGWQHFIAHQDEAKMLHELAVVIAERDPDVIEGHNIFKFDLWYIANRASLRKVKLTLGRDGSELSVHPSRIQIAERTINYPKYEIFGRHIVDTFLLVQAYDVANRELESFSLKEVAKHFNVASPQRTYLKPDEIAETFHKNPDRVRAYAMDDVCETRAIAEILSQSYFVQAQIFPFRYQDVVVRGNATKIDSLFLREYLAQRHSIPQPDAARPFAGGYTDIFFTGVARNVWHCDVQSLYPSIILSFDILPGRDEKGIFRSLLGDLRRFRLEAKAALKAAKMQAERDHFDALQSTFKILINSFYGYLGFSQAHFGDYDAAERVTAKGREILTQMIEWLKARGAQLIEIDTDGIYFVPPANGADKLEDDLQATLPPGIDVEFDGRFRAMFSYKMKNYALLDEQGRLMITGAALRSRGLEKFQRQFLEEFLMLVMTGKQNDVPALLDRYRQAIEKRQGPIEMLMKTETLQDSVETYQTKIRESARNRSAAYELALKSGQNYQPGDQVSFYITGSGKRVSAYENSKLASEWNPQKRDENVEYYLDKLDQLHAKFAPLCGLAASKSQTADPKQGTLF
jgi:DNA polymerase elongation subunit (family B)